MTNPTFVFVVRKFFPELTGHYHNLVLRSITVKKGKFHYLVQGGY